MIARIFTRGNAITVLVVGTLLHCFFAFLAPFDTSIHRYLNIFCHQKPDRCFEYAGLHMGVCARCIGIYAGFLVGALLFKWRGLLPQTFIAAFSIIGIGSIALWHLKYDLPIIPRCIAGFCLGIFMFVFIAKVLKWGVELFAFSLCCIEYQVMRIKDCGLRSRPLP